MTIERDVFGVVRRRQQRSMLLLILPFIVTSVSALEAQVDSHNSIKSEHDSDCRASDVSCSAQAALYKGDGDDHDDDNNVLGEKFGEKINDGAAVKSADMNRSDSDDGDDDGIQKTSQYDESGVKVIDEKSGATFEDEQHYSDDDYKASALRDTLVENYDEEKEFDNDKEYDKNDFFQAYSLDNVTDGMFQIFSDPDDDMLLWHHTPFGVDQQVNRGDEEMYDAVVEVLDASHAYMMDEVLVETYYESVRDSCRLRHELCAIWAASGECEKNPKYMQVDCAPVCQSCEMLNDDIRCSWDTETTPNAWEAPTMEGFNEASASTSKTLNTMFERLILDPWYQKQYRPTVHSRDPWVVTLENFLTEEECSEIIRMGTEAGYQRSGASSGEVLTGFTGIYQSSQRTSHNAWCDKQNGCYNSAVGLSVLQRIHNITSIPIGNYEHLQLLKYQVGQFYRQHHDYFLEHRDRPSGVRILTVFLYLNDVEQGGGTSFPLLNGMTIQPKRGRALLWPNVLSESPHDKDDRTDHEALPVMKGEKYAANAWVHQREFIEPYENNCT